MKKRLEREALEQDHDDWIWVLGFGFELVRFSHEDEDVGGKVNREGVRVRAMQRAMQMNREMKMKKFIASASLWSSGLTSDILFSFSFFLLVDHNYLYFVFSSFLSFLCFLQVHIAWRFARDRYLLLILMFMLINLIASWFIFWEPSSTRSRIDPTFCLGLGWWFWGCIFLTGCAILSYQMTPGPSGVDAYQSGIGNPISISRDHHNLPRSQVHTHGRRVYTPGSDCYGEIGGEVPWCYGTITRISCNRCETL